MMKPSSRVGIFWSLAIVLIGTDSPALLAQQADRDLLEAIEVAGRRQAHEIQSARVVFKYRNGGAREQLSGPKVDAAIEKLRRAMVRKEIHCHLIGYNIVGAAMIGSALKSQRRPNRLSFTGSLQASEEFAAYLSRRSGRYCEQWECLLRTIAKLTVGNRSNRKESRQIKRGPKPYRATAVSPKVDQDPGGYNELEIKLVPFNPDPFSFPRSTCQIVANYPSWRNRREACSDINSCASEDNFDAMLYS
ncbi:hypothetical protein DTL21_04390 [Bremerella cremea]|uniref:Uncharacterized protein n=1 Tax=Blastopirellula marina TaxID=124 RepID=A0A2S8FYC6_9BACT|nr:MULTISPECIES: hypothetical protein [Pirellulaceae]PQO37196.1 hypothetical protein C5Y83_04390 [Blastopirellula marina]RCS49583.1 hypothetical protein DTL21_04390 [Bremerella cremea]